jgi:ABC-type multidrug transport system permease subunit
LSLLIVAYAAAGFFWAKRFFLRVQDTQWTGGVIALPNWGELFTGRSALSGLRRRKPLRALLWKEFQAQQVNVLLAGGLLLVHLGVVLVSRWSVEYLATHRSIAMVLEMVPLLWLAMPLLIGSVAVAEERKLGTYQSSLCLPVSRWRQFMAKLLVAMTLGLFLGAIVPLLIETLGMHHARSDQTGLS